MKYKLTFLTLLLAMNACNTKSALKAEVYETSAEGRKMELIQEFTSVENAPIIKLNPTEKFQTITGFGGAFTESSAYLLNKMSSENREEVLKAYFSDEGAKYSLTRTHINSCDFSVSNYSYAPVEDDVELEHFSVDEDRDDIIPMIKDAMEISTEGFKIVSSPWTAPPWMKDNNEWKGGSLLPEHYDTWARFFSKYLKAYKEEGIDVWAVTVENEPHGNGSNWESMHYSPEEMNTFIKDHLGPTLRANGQDTKILGYDQNKGKELTDWVEIMLTDEEVSEYLYGTAVHWYTGTNIWFPESLQKTHELAPDKHIIATENCVDAQVPRWKEDDWYWKREATDWGYEWAPEEDKTDHPKYVPVYRYARDIIGDLNNWVEGWIDWNMVLDSKGGPNWAKNFCVAPVIVDPETDEVYYTPIYYVLSHFSKHLRPGSQVIGVDNPDESLMVTAVQDSDNSYAVVILNQSKEPKAFSLQLGEKQMDVSISGQAIQTIALPNQTN